MMLLAIALVWWCVPASAQQPAPPPAEADSPAEQLAPETNPAVLAALELPRTEPKHYLSAVLALVDLNRPQLAAPILKELVELKLSDEQQAALVSEFGSHRLLKLARTAELAPTAQQFAEACMTAAAAIAHDPQRIAKLVAELNAPSASVRNAARFDLASAGEPGVVAALEALARETDLQRRNMIAAAIIHMDPAAVGPLLGMLSTNDAALRADVAKLLEAMHVTQAMPLLATATSANDAERMLVDAIGRYQRGTSPFLRDENDRVLLWYWNDSTNKLHSIDYSADESCIIWSARLAMALAQLCPERRDYQRHAIVLGLEADLLEWNRTPQTRSEPPELHALTDRADGAMLSAVLADAMKQDYAHAAAAAAELLGEREDASVLNANTPQPAPLADALVYPNRRVRFAALAAIMALDPKSPFPGASRVPDTLGYFATGANERRAVVAMPVADQVTTLAGRLANIGVEAEPTSRGGSAVALAEQSADLEMVLVDVDIDGPGVRDVLYALRTDPATGQVPIGLLATSDRLDAAHRIASEHKRVVAFPRPQSDAALEELVTRLNEVSGRESVSPQDRAVMAGQALDWLGNLLARDHTFYDLHRQAPVVEAALYMPAMTERAVKVLALLGTPNSQRSLVDFASHLSVPVAARELSARAFTESVQRHGILLTEAEIIRQYDRYNASSSLDAATQQVFASLLDTLESLRAQADARQFR